MSDFQQEDLVLIGADVIALSPSMDPIRTGAVIRSETINSNIDWKMDWLECAKYLKMNLSPYEARLKGVAHLLPDRLHTKGPAPGMSSVNAKLGDKTKEEK